MAKLKDYNEVAKLFWTQKVEKGTSNSERVFCEDIYDEVLSPRTVHKFWISRKQVNWMRSVGMNPMHLRGKNYFSQGSFDEYTMWEINISANGAGMISVFEHDQIEQHDELSVHILRRWHEQSVVMMRESRGGEQECDYNARCYHMLKEKMIDVGYLAPESATTK